MNRAFPLLSLALLLGAAAPICAQAAGGEESAIRSAIKSQSDAWNRADIPGFMDVYEDSPDTTFMGATTLRKGVKPIRERYELTYTTPALMGKLTFSDIEVRLLPGSCGKAEFALVTGKFHLDRDTRGEGQKDDGVFSLLWRKGPKGWKIILDHTS
jgi:ketosteroid isomerase-like protein